MTFPIEYEHRKNDAKRAAWTERRSAILALEKFFAELLDREI